MRRKIRDKPRTKAKTFGRLKPTERAEIIERHLQQEWGSSRRISEANRETIRSICTDTKSFTTALQKVKNELGEGTKERGQKVTARNRERRIESLTRSIRNCRGEDALHRLIWRIEGDHSPRDIAAATNRYYESLEREGYDTYEIRSMVRPLVSYVEGSGDERAVQALDQRIKSISRRDRRDRRFRW